LYKNGTNNISDVVKEVLINRGIKDYNTYLNLDESVIQPYSRLDNIYEGVDMFMGHFNNRNGVGILVDEDPDGFCSAAMMYLYIKRMDNQYPIKYILHQRAKAHGLSDDVSIPDDIKLLIIPDAGTNDKEECKRLKGRNIDILILDHHEIEEKNQNAIIINNQSSDSYTNKSLCGAGIVYRFLQALDDVNWTEFADDYLDLCALANISDVMDMRSFETRYITNIGLLNIKNKCLEALIKAQDYSMNGKVNIHNVQWYITPILNGMIRVGSLEEKELLFRAFIEKDEFFEWKKRAVKGNPPSIVQESIYDRAARLCKNAKARQDKSKEKSVSQIIEIAESEPYDDKVLMIDTSGILDNGLTGVVAIKIAERFNKPCILLNKYVDSKTGELVYGGSARNINHSPIDSFKDIINSTGVFNFGKGHANAFGVNIDISLKNKAVNVLNDILRDTEYNSTYNVDFILDIEEIDISLIMSLSIFEDIIGQGIDEPMFAVENIILSRDQFELFGKKEDTISFCVNDIKYVQFKCREGNELYDWLNNSWDSDDIITFNIVGKPAVNEYMGTRTPQIIIEDLVVINTTNDIDEDEDW